jgi:transposase
MCRKRLPNTMEAFLRFVAPYGSSLAIGLESTFNWYWFYDGCVEHGLEVYLGNPYYMKAISCDKRKNDRLDAEKIANLLRAGMFPLAHGCSGPKRSVRDLVRQRNKLVYMRSDLLGHTRCSFYQQGDLGMRSADIKNKSTRMAAVQHFKDKDVRYGAERFMAVTNTLDRQVHELEQHIATQAQLHYGEEMVLLRGIPGAGPVISTTIVYETDAIARFRKRQHYSSYCRLSKPSLSSNGKRVGTGNRKCGNAHLKWAFMELAGSAAIHHASIRQTYETLQQKHEPLVARSIMANHFCTVVYHMLKNKQQFDVERFCQSISGVDSQTPETGGLPQAA